MSILNDFGVISGYKINFSKSVLFLINDTARHKRSIFSSYPFTITNHFKYLGINITQEFSGLFKYNFSTLYEQTKQNLEKWNKLPVSLVGRINIIRMNILPKFLFLFQCIPLYITKKFFTKLDSLISQFIWNRKNPRIKKAYLQRPKELGGMGLPRFRFYYWSCNIRAISFWCNVRGVDWAEMENQSCHLTSLQALIFASLKTTVPKLKNPVVSHSVKIWLQIRKHFKWQEISVLTPITQNHEFPQALQEISFVQWKAKGINTIQDLFIDKIFGTFDQLCGKYQLSKTDFFKYLQIRSFAKTLLPSFPSQPINSEINTVLLKTPLKKGSISKICNDLAAKEYVPSLDYLKEAWQQDLGINITASQWTMAQNNVHSSSICARHGLLQFKVLHRLHLSKVKLSKMFQGINTACPRCGQDQATLAHTFWKCPSITSYWTKIFNMMSNVCQTKLDPDPMLALFGVHPGTTALLGKKKTVLKFVTVLSRRLILLNWNQTNPPTYINLLNDIMKHVQLEKIKFELKVKADDFYLTWGAFLEYYNKYKHVNA